MADFSTGTDTDVAGIGVRCIMLIHVTRSDVHMKQLCSITIPSRRL